MQDLYYRKSEDNKMDVIELYRLVFKYSIPSLYLFQQLKRS